MATVVTKTIGTGGDYTSLQAWEDACPSNLVTADEIWRGEVLNQELVGALTLQGQTTDATRYIELTAAAGASFADNANKLTNALTYNASNGAAIRVTSGTAVYVNTGYVRISKLQIASPESNGFGITSSLNNSQLIADQLIVSAFYRPLRLEPKANGVITLSNSLVSTTGAGQQHGIITVQFQDNTTANILNCTIAACSDVGLSGSSAGVWVQVSATSVCVVKNSAIFGYNSAFSGTPSAGTDYNASDKTLSIGTNNQASLTYADQFEGVTVATADFRIKTGAGLIDTGTDLSASGVTTDIVGTARG
jgi:hypothetical protein